MEVGSSSLPGTTHRRKAMCSGSKSAWDYRRGFASSEEWKVKSEKSFVIHYSLFTRPQAALGGLAQLARAPALQAGGQRFESVILHEDPMRMSWESR